MRFFPRASALAASRCSVAALLIAVLGLLPTAAFAEYKLQSGDTLEISVASVPGFKERLLIGMDGKISLPLAGQIKVDDLSLAAASAKIAGDLSNKIYRQPGADGREIDFLIVPEDVVVRVAEYRPIYVSGDVAKPGEYAFRPGMTVRQALAGAGGLTPSGVTNPYLETADLRAEYESLGTEFAREQARAWRVRSELGEPGGKLSDQQVPIATGVSHRIMKVETAQLDARIADRQKDMAFLQSAIAKADLQLSTLAEKQKADQQGHHADLSDLAKIRELYDHGLATVTRLSDARRANLLSSDQLLQTVLDMSNIERQRGDYVRQLAKVDDQNRIDDLKELQDTDLRLAQITARLKSIREKLAYLGLMKSQLMQGPGRQPVVRLYRGNDKGTRPIASADQDLDLALAPGDVVEVSLRNDRVAQGLLTPSENMVAAAGAP